MNSTQHETSLRPKNRIATTILACVALAFWIGGGVVLGSNYDTSGAIPVVVAWLAGLAFLAFLLCWSVAGRIVVARHGDQLTVKSKIGNFGILGGKSVSLADAKHMAVEARVYGYKGKKIPRYSIVIDQSGKRREFLGFLTKDHVELLVNGALRGLVDSPP